MDDEIRKEDIKKTSAEVTENELETVSGGSLISEKMQSESKPKFILDKKPQNRMEMLSSGLRINSAADDAAGYALGEKMRQKIRSLDNYIDDDN